MKRGSSGTSVIRSWESYGAEYLTLTRLPVNYKRNQQWGNKCRQKCYTDIVDSGQDGYHSSHKPTTAFNVNLHMLILDEHIYGGQEEVIQTTPAYQ